MGEGGFIPREEKLSTFTAVRPRAGRALGGLCFAPSPAPRNAGLCTRELQHRGTWLCDLSAWVRGLRGRAAPPDYQVR